MCERVFAVLLVAGLIGSLALPVSASDEEEAEHPSVVIEKWLVLGPANHPLPLFGNDGDDDDAIEPASLLEAEILAGASRRARAGERLGWFAGRQLDWRERKAKKGELRLDASDDEVPQVAWLATYITVPRWQKLELEIVGSQPRRAWLDGEPLAKAGAKKTDDPLKSTLELTTGTHLLAVQTVTDPERDEPWTISGSIASTDESEPQLKLSTASTRQIELRDILDAPTIGSLALSPDGTRVVTSVRRIVPGTDKRESWIEVRDTVDGRLTDTWRGTVGARQVGWSPDGRFVSYVAGAAGRDKASTLFLFDREQSRVIPLLEGVENMTGYQWSPTSDAIVFGTQVERDEFDDGVKRLEGLRDRWASFRNKTHLNLVTVPDGLRRQLTAGEMTSSARAFSPDGTRLLFSRQVDELSRRPYTRTELWEMDLEAFTANKLRDFNWFNDVAYSPDGKRLLVAAHAAEFDGKGVTVPDSVIPNSYDGQLFIWEPSTDEVDAITRDFDPAVQQAVWSRADGNIWIRGQDRDFARLYRYDPRRATFESIDVGVDILGSLELADDAPLAVGLGTSPWVPQQLLAVDLRSGKARRLAHPADEWFEDVGSGTLETWDFTASNGKTIEGRIYLPPDFDPKGKYPLIVYYYGGTSPTSRAFGGRYPKEWWSAQGYVVYVLQPSGATGFGQAFSAAHVNDWGKTTSEEIIEGTRKFLEAHPYADPDRVGCIGASYGGFMTMLLSTKTDLFAASVAHAGISSISSYWGEGYWGYLYSAVATAESFPWNRPDIYVDQSPLFRADQAQVPILLTHGVSDTNVPKGESDAFYIALKLLGKTVEYIQFEGEDHWILTHGKRVTWSKSIVAWFDRWLKEEPEWWNALYPE